MSKVLITTVPFAEKNRLPLEILDNAGIDYLINPKKKKLKEDQLANMVSDFDAIIAGTDPITENVMDHARNLKLISRVGVGLDSVDLIAAKKRGIKVSYTPNAPTPAVAEMTIGLMISLLRSTHVSNSQMHQGQWYRFYGSRLEEVCIGIIGVGRIGTNVLKILNGFGSSNILVNDIEPNLKLDNEFKIKWTPKENIYKEADIISLHLPLTPLTKNLICKEQLLTMKRDTAIVNTSRGGIVNESDLYEVMQCGFFSGVAIDVFEKEPYNGPLKNLERCLLTSHMGSMSTDCRMRMEIESTEEAVRFLTGKPLKSEVPYEEYDLQCN